MPTFVEAPREILTFNLMHALRADDMDCNILSVIPYTSDDDNVISLTEEEYNRWFTKANSIINKLTFYKGSDQILETILRMKYEELKPQILVNQTCDLITTLPVNPNVAQFLIGRYEGTKRVRERKTYPRQNLQGT